MNLYDIVAGHLSAGTFVSIVVILLTLVEITPIKISPLNWIGSRVNKATLERVEKINTKLDEHIAQSYRSKILNFQSKLIEKGISGHSQEEWAEVINACENYEDYIHENKLSNGMCELAIKFIQDSYVECLHKRDFVNIPCRSGRDSLKELYEETNKNK